MEEFELFKNLEAKLQAQRLKVESSDFNRPLGRVFCDRRRSGARICRYIF